MFLDLDRKKTGAYAVLDDSGQQLTYGELLDFSDEFYSSIKKRTLIFILSENVAGALAGYVAALINDVVPLIIGNNIDKDLFAKLVYEYKPEFIWHPDKTEKIRESESETVFQKYGYALSKTQFTTPALHKSLSLLLTTSGSTGSPKLVRHSYHNVEANAKNVASFFKLSENEKPIAILPLQYTMGLSVVTSHLYAGAMILLVNSNLTERFFWDFIKQNKATSFTGVPYSYEILNKLRFFRMNLPHLKTLSQGGGKLNHSLFKAIAEFAHNNEKKFFATYGQTEGTARMAFLPPEKALEKTGSIGKEIPNGKLFLIDDNGNKIANRNAAGELVYEGPNVTMGYAYTLNDLVKGDENKGRLQTGDIAERDEDGFYYIIGRKQRFLKLYGVRISLDETEHLVKSAFDIDCACIGNDEKMTVIITSEHLKDSVHNYLIEKTGLYHKAIEMEIRDELPKNEAGKTIYT